MKLLIAGDSTAADYPEGKRQMARKLNVPLIDLHAETRRLYEELGPESSRRLFVWLRPGEHPNYPDGAADNTHFNEDGAREVAQLAAAGLSAVISGSPAD